MLTFSSSGQTFQQTVDITDRNFNFFSIKSFYYLSFFSTHKKVKVLDMYNSTSNSSLDMMLNSTLTLYTAVFNDSIIVNYGDSSSSTLKLLSGLRINL